MSKTRRKFDREFREGRCGYPGYRWHSTAFGRQCAEWRRLRVKRDV